MQLIVFNWENFNLVITKHAEIRLNERNISLDEVQDVLISYDKIYENFWKKVAEKDINWKKIRIVFTIKKPNLILITTIIKL